MSKEKICTSCGYIGKPVAQCYDSFLLDAFIWMIVGGIVLMTGLIPLLVLPLGWTIYHVLRFRSVKCPKCENLDMVSLNSRKGKLTERTIAHKA